MRRTNSKTLLFQPSVSLVKLQAAKEEETTTKDTNEIIKIKTLNIIKQAIRYHQDIPEWGVPAINTQNTRILTYLQSFLRVHRTMGDLPLTISRFCLFATCEGEEPSLSCWAVNGWFFWNPGKFQIVLLEFLDIFTPKRGDASGNIPRDTTCRPQNWLRGFESMNAMSPQYYVPERRNAANARRMPTIASMASQLDSWTCGWIPGIHIFIMLSYSIGVKYSCRCRRKNDGYILPI